MKRPHIACASLAAALQAVATAQVAGAVRTPVPDARPVMLAALQATDGRAHGVLTGDLADAITRRFAASSPVHIDVTTEKRYRQAGCARLHVVFWQDGVWLPGVDAPRRQTLAIGIDYCLDGLPPRTLD